MQALKLLMGTMSWGNTDALDKAKKLVTFPETNRGKLATKPVKPDFKGKLKSSTDIQDGLSEAELNLETFGLDEGGFLEKIMAEWPEEETKPKFSGHNPHLVSKNDEMESYNSAELNRDNKPSAQSHFKLFSMAENLKNLHPSLHPKKDYNTGFVRSHLPTNSNTQTDFYKPSS